jgi:hypothetical protein
MNSIGRSILPELLALQCEPEEDFDDVEIALRLRAVLASGRELEADLVDLIWRSPTIRSIYQRLKAEALSAFVHNWKARGFVTSIEPLAASSEGDNDNFVVAGLQFHMVRNYATGKWVLTLQLTPDAMEELTPGISVRVSDKGGVVWLDGKLDRQGSLDGFWYDQGNSPQERAALFGLNIDFY